MYLNTSYLSTSTIFENGAPFLLRIRQNITTDMKGSLVVTSTRQLDEAGTLHCTDAGGVTQYVVRGTIGWLAAVMIWILKQKGETPVGDGTYTLMEILSLLERYPSEYDGRICVLTGRAVQVQRQVFWAVVRMINKRTNNPIAIIYSQCQFKVNNQHLRQVHYCFVIMEVETTRYEAHGLIIFKQQRTLTSLQERLAEGIKGKLTIDWGDYQRHRWSQLAPEVSQITAKQLVLREQPLSTADQRDNRHCISPFDLPQSEQNGYDEDNNRIATLQTLPKLRIPYLKQLSMSCNHVVSARSLVKAYFPQLQKINFAENPLIDCHSMFKCNFPQLQQMTIDQNGKEAHVKSANSWSDPVIWKIKLAPVLVKDRQGFSRRRFLNVGQNTQFEFRKYVEIMNHKPSYSPRLQ